MVTRFDASGILTVGRFWREFAPKFWFPYHSLGDGRWDKRTLEILTMLRRCLAAYGKSWP
ncbi:MAG: hypothetical protein B9S26_13520 [Opitutia bacterium Tous-C4FEB]|nr:MAG: hypothetical protein B9S26_13520 [Opitutae bacterium Tous-C4FEB]